jgi:5-methylcytosine-specific restriction endonuclease McrA
MLCRKNPVAISGKTKTGRLRFKKRCVECIKVGRAIRLNGNRDFVRSHKKTYCEECGFVAAHICQLDVDHIDGNRLNMSPDNFRTLCANCHRLKTQVNGDWVSYKRLYPVESKQIDLI